MESLRYWSLKRPPFSPEQPFFSATPQRVALSEIGEAISNDTRLVVLSNPGGCGCTTLLRHLSQSSGLNNEALEMTYCDIANVSSRELNAGPGKFHRFVPESENNGMKSVWLVDHCSPFKLPIVRKLVDQTPGLYAVVGVAMPKFRVVRWDETQVRLNAFTVEETEAYIDHSFQSVGIHQSPFTAAGLKTIHTRSGGRVKRIGQFATSAMDRFAA